jgi:enamine deaminase RidA (YjgF/YER057c/UK114 family)
MKQQISTPAAPAAIGPYSQAIGDGEWLFCSGQIGIDPSSGRLVEGGIEHETRRRRTEPVPSHQKQAWESCVHSRP